jgi:hypothetical protein
MEHFLNVLVTDKGITSLYTFQNLKRKNAGTLKDNQGLQKDYRIASNFGHNANTALL